MLWPLVLSLLILSLGGFSGGIAMLANRLFSDHFYHGRAWPADSPVCAAAGS
jgi:hypothetical protein